MSQFDIKAKAELLSQLENSVGKERFDNWFKKIEFISAGENAVHIPVPNSFYQDFAEREFRKPIEEAFGKVFGNAPEIVFKVTEMADIETDLRQAEPRLDPSTKTEAPAPPLASNAPRLNGEYTFENFVVGPSNRLAHAAAMRVSEKPGGVYNPLFLYGTVGLGKTHLLHAICHEIRKQSPHLRIAYISSENFVNEFVYSLKKGALESFRNKNRNVDVFVVDDIHFFADKEGSKEELFHTFNAIHGFRKQMIFSSDAAPKDIPNLEERLVSRFQMGFVAGIDTPTYETRLAILHSKAETRDIRIPDDVLHFIATSVRSNIRELEGAINKIVGISTLTARTIDIDLARDALADTIVTSTLPLTIQEIQRIVCKCHNVTVQELQAKGWSKRISASRQLCAYLARTFTNSSLKEIGEHLGGKDHATVMYYIAKIEGALLTDGRLRADLDALSDRIRKRLV